MGCCFCITFIIEEEHIMNTLRKILLLLLGADLAVLLFLVWPLYKELVVLFVVLWVVLALWREHD